ncbi:hypothetical protein CRUP_014655 [Coryphaenoides rupestris]|nr:hypothetical protein CRUP_014655 [Coryphaenoides rupestris]
MKAQSECSRVVWVSTERRSISREVKPEPVPPPKEWKMRKPWSPGPNKHGRLGTCFPGRVGRSRWKKVLEGVVPAAGRLVAGHLAIGLDAVLQAQCHCTHAAEQNAEQTRTQSRTQTTPQSITDQHTVERQKEKHGRLGGIRIRLVCVTYA